MHDEPAVRLATARDIPELADAAAHAFADDPLWDWILRDDAKRLRRLTRFFTTLLKIDFRYRCRVIATVDAGTAMASWAQPRRRHRSVRVQLELAIGVLRALGLGGALRLGVVEARLDRSPLGEKAAWYLELLATHPDHQGHGEGSALLRGHLATLGSDQAVTLATQTERNVSFYARFGFAEIETFLLPFRGPRMWVLKRPAN